MALVLKEGSMTAFAFDEFVKSLVLVYLEVTVLRKKDYLEVLESKIDFDKVHSSTQFFSANLLF